VCTSNIITTKLSVILETPARKAPAPTMAKIPGDIVPIHCPMMRPNSAPASRAGMMTPEGTFMPNVMIVRTSLTKQPYTSHAI
jgi:hypothetical protein